MPHVGFAETDITPKMGSESPGGMQKRILKEVIDPLKAVAMVVSSGKEAVALVGIDALFVTAETTAKARSIIEKQTKITGDHVVIGASHTHSGGPVASCFECEADPEYLNMLAGRI